ncbi:hypothetical protein EYZ11_012473 [Aspergillus tanneri]|uniref:Uncharacterized protein n=1 Tax=Aspergillus tanneri TaxID=1220188 RepID=A0A4S3J0R1_9EURO|nr:hypothetical protein EYZ11_012473 [Aspergillus tanneri]
MQIQSYFHIKDKTLSLTEYVLIGTPRSVMDNARGRSPTILEGFKTPFLLHLAGVSVVRA